MCRGPAPFVLERGFIMQFEIMYYKFLGSLICLCPVKVLKDKLLNYAQNRFPRD